ncbi:MAG: cytochrome P450 [Pseudomonadales bacterium]|nr:cytochrome P450 [Pseudomonadales bacterium]
MSLFAIETLLDPYPAYKEKRDEQPVHFEESMNIHVVTRYDLVREAIRDTATYSSQYDQFLAASQIIAFEQAAPEVQQQLTAVNAKMVVTPPTMLTLDEPDHTRYRSLVNQLFTASQVRLSEPTVQAVVDENAERMFARDHAEYMSEFAFPVPLKIIGDRLGIPENERTFFDRAATDAASGLRLTPLSGEQMIARAQTAVDLQQFLIGIVEARRQTPQEDMITILANAKLEGEDRLLTHGECLSVLNQFLVAGHETTSSAFGWGMLLLCRNPVVQDEMRGNDKLIKTFVEEILRLEAPVQGLPRLVTKDTELGGFPLRAGELVMLRYGAANRDERQFEAPDSLDIHRAKAGAQLAFGAGVHFCIGAPLARQELNLGFKKLLALGCDFRLEANTPEPVAEASFILRNLPELRIQYRAR